MFKNMMFVWGVMAVIIMPSFSYGQAVSQLNTEEYTNAYLQKIHRESPVLYELEQKFNELQREIKSIVRKYQNKAISLEEARDEIKPLIERQYDIRQSKEYQVEQMIVGMLMDRSSVGSSMPMMLNSPDKR